MLGAGLSFLRAPRKIDRATFIQTYGEIPIFDPKTQLAQKLIKYSATWWPNPYKKHAGGCGSVLPQYQPVASHGDFIYTTPTVFQGYDFCVEQAFLRKGEARPRSWRPIRRRVPVGAAASRNRVRRERRLRRIWSYPLILLARE